MPTEATNAAELAVRVRTLLVGIDPASLGADTRARCRAAVEDVRAEALTLAARWDSVHGDSSAEVRLRGALDRLIGALPEPGWLGDARSEWLALRERLAPIYAALAEALPQPDVQDAAAHPRPENLTRTVVHALSGMGIVIAFHTVVSFEHAWWVALPWATVAWTLEVTRRIFPAWNEHLMAVLGRIAHAHEARRINSATWYSTALLVMSLTAPGPGAMVGVLALAFGDPAASLVGRRFGRIRIASGRSLEGSAAFAVVTAVVATIYLALAAPELGAAVGIVAVPTAVTAAATEAFVRKIDDNLAVPIVAGSVATALLHLLGSP